MIDTEEQKEVKEVAVIEKVTFETETLCDLIRRFSSITESAYSETLKIGEVRATLSSTNMHTQNLSHREKEAFCNAYRDLGVREFKIYFPIGIPEYEWDRIREIEDAFDQKGVRLILYNTFMYPKVLSAEA